MGELLFETFLINGTNITYPYYQYQEPGMAMSFQSQVLITTAFTINMILSIVGNVTFLWVLIWGRATRTDLNAFLINLAVADLLMAIFCMPFTFPTIMFGHWIFGKAMCPTVIFMQQVSTIVNILTLTAVGIDRYFAVIYPLKVRVTKNRAKIVFIIIWSIALSMGTLQTVFVRVEKIDDYGQTIYFCKEWLSEFKFAKVYEIFMMAIAYVIPLCILAYTYCSIGVRLWGRTIPGNADQVRDQSQAKAKKKVIKMLIIVVVLFTICWLPVHVFKIITIFYPRLYGDLRYQDTMRILNCTVLWLAMADSFVNPFIYGFLNDAFRNDLKALMHRTSLFLFGERQSRLRSRTIQSRSSVSATRTISLSSVSFLRRSQASSSKSMRKVIEVQETKKRPEQIGPEIT
ncbi:RYamide receptor-like [Glandiceps talaboti]